jgi:hypothetical protein
MRRSAASIYGRTFGIVFVIQVAAGRRGGDRVEVAGHRSDPVQGRVTIGFEYGGWLTLVHRPFMVDADRASFKNILSVLTATAGCGAPFGS